LASREKGKFCFKAIRCKEREGKPVLLHTFLSVHFIFYGKDMISLFFWFSAASQSSEKYTFADIIFGNEQVCK
jgi:hypothetical protein